MLLCVLKMIFQSFPILINVLLEFGCYYNLHDQNTSRIIHIII